MRVSAFAHWPGKIAAGTVVKEPLHIVDWYPTMLKLAGAKLEQKLPLDGRDAWATIAAGKPTPHPEILLNTTPANGAIRAGDWKLHRSDSKLARHVVVEAQLANSDVPQFQLFNLADDPAEKTNIIDKLPDVAARLKAQLAQIIAGGRSRP